jgi:hypothetical protein
MVLAQQQGTGEVDREAQAGYRDRLIEADGHGRGEALGALGQDQEGHHGQARRAGEAPERSDLAGPEAVARILGVAAPVGVGQGCHAERGRMGRHVPAVGEERHGAEGQPRGDLERLIMARVRPMTHQVRCSPGARGRVPKG